MTATVSGNTDDVRADETHGEHQTSGVDETVESNETPETFADLDPDKATAMFRLMDVLRPYSEGFIRDVTTLFSRENLEPALRDLMTEGRHKAVKYFVGGSEELGRLVDWNMDRDEGIHIIIDSSRGYVSNARLAREIRETDRQYQAKHGPDKSLIRCCVLPNLDGATEGGEQGRSDGTPAQGGM